MKDTFKGFDPRKWDERYFNETCTRYIEIGKPIEYLYEKKLFLFD